MTTPSDDNIEVKISADASSLKGGMAEGAKSVESETQNIAESFKKMNGSVTGAMTEVKRSVDGALGGVMDTFKKFQGVFIGLTAVLAGGAAFKGVINASNEWTGEATKLSKALGITVDKASVLNVALNHLGISTDQYTGAAAVMSKQINAHGQAFEELGVKVKDTTGAYRPVTEVMSDVNAKLAAIKNPIEQNIAGMQVYGRGWQELKPILRVNAEELKNAEERAKSLGLIVGPEGAAMTKQYKEQMRDLSLVGKSLEVQFGQKLLPVFLSTGKWLGEEGPAMSEMFGSALKGLVIAVGSLYYGFLKVGTAIGGTAAALAALASGDVSGARSIFKSMSSDLDAVQAKYEKFVAETLNPPPIKPGKAPDTQEGPHYDFGKDAKDPGRMPEFEAGLAKKRDGLERQAAEEGKFREMSKQEEADYWSAILKRADLTSKEKAGVQAKYYAALSASRKDAFAAEITDLEGQKELVGKNYTQRIAIAEQVYQRMADAYGKESKEAKKAYDDVLKERQKLADQQIKIAQEVAHAQAQMRLIDLDAEQAHAQAVADMAGASVAKKVEIDRSYLDQRHAMELADAEQAIKSVNPERDPEEYQKLCDKKLEIEAKYRAQVKALQDKSSADALKPATSTIDGTANAFSKSMEGIMKKTMTMGQALQNVWKGFRDSGIKAISDLLAAKFAAWAKERMLAMAGIGTDAAKAGTGAAASQAAIPIVGPGLALAAMASTFAAVFGMSSKVPSASAAGGFDIPAGLNPVTQLHQREMVLPASIADPLRSNLANGGVGGGDTHLHFNGYNSRELEDLLMRRGGADILVKALAERRRNGGI